MKREIKSTAELPVNFLLDIIKRLPNPSTYPNTEFKCSYQTVLNDVKPFGSDIDREFDTTEIIFTKEKVMGEHTWVLQKITRERTTVYLKDYIPNKS